MHNHDEHEHHHHHHDTETADIPADRMAVCPLTGDAIDTAEAEKECEKVNAILTDGKAVVQEFPNIGICLMLKTANDAIKELGIIQCLTHGK